VIWQDWNGRAGVQFVDVPKASRKLLTEYLAAHRPSEVKEEAPDVTVEMEELQVMHGAMMEHTQGGATAEQSAPEVGGSGSAVAVESDPNNRRTQTRYACRLSAEVYRTGTSVPTHCCLTDLSAGGCYLEVPLPFPKTSEVEIVVRTHDLKLRLRGTVQAAHPGYGMGIAFELKTKDEQSSVKKLTDFVAATTKPSN
jgi:hypothetical protein